MYYRLIIALIVSVSILGNLTGCKEIPPSLNKVPPPPVNPSIYTILPYDSTAMVAMDWHYKDACADSLTPAEVDDLEPIVDSAYRAFTKDSTVYLHNLLPLKQYCRQYVVVITANGEKEVWVNFLCADLNGNWRYQGCYS